MSVGPGYYLRVKHATEDKWLEVGPDPTRWGLFQIRANVDAMEQVFKRLGIETEVKEIQVEYDDRG